MAHRNLTKAKRARKDEFYTLYRDIETEIAAYLEFDPDVFRGKVVYCNCDDPFESNFLRYFANKFKNYGIKKLIATSYAGSPIAQTQIQLPLFKEFDNNKGKNKIAFRIEINDVSDITKDGITNLGDVKWLLEHDKNASLTLNGDEKYAPGDFRSKECIKLLKEADIVVTNPPFSSFREYIRQLVEYDKKFIIIGNINAITYKEVFPLIKDNKIWLGATNFNKGMYFQVPDDFVYAKSYKFYRELNGVKVNRVAGVCWFTNIDHGRRHQPLPLMTMEDNIKFSRHKEIRGKGYQKYDNYDAIEVPFVDAIPSDYDGVMGVPITFLDKYNPEQFELIGSNRGIDQDPDGIYGRGSFLNGKETFKRIFIKHKR